MDPGKHNLINEHLVHYTYVLITVVFLFILNFPALWNLNYRYTSLIRDITHESFLLRKVIIIYNFITNLG